MEICYSAIVLVFFAIILAIAANYYNDQNSRRKKAAVLDHLRNSKILHMDVKGSTRAVSPVGFQALWQRAEVILAENVVFYFGYSLLFGRLRMHHGIAQLSIRNTTAPQLLSGIYSFFIDSAKLDKSTLKIAYSRDNDLLPTKRIMTLVIDDAGKLDEIKRMLKIVEAQAGLGYGK